MPTSARPIAAVPAKGAAFASTQWSMVLGARSDSTGRREALERLCAAYWLPLYGYLRLRGHAPADAEDLTQSFLAYLVASDFLDRSDPEKGRFRGYLVGALKHFLSHHFDHVNAQKRGGGATFIDWSNLDAEAEFTAIDQAQLDPAQAYEKTWALTLLARALRRLESEQTAAGKGSQFAVLQGFLSAKPTRGDYGEAAKELGASRTTVAVWIHRLNQRYAELVQLEVTDTVRDPAEVPQEMQHLLQALRS